MANNQLGAAQKAKNDEFYTRFDDIQVELNHYRDQFKGKVVYCNCDDPAESAFADFFKLNFDYYGLKKLICTRYAKSDLFLQFDMVRRIGYKLEITGKDKCEKTDLVGGGDFRSRECIELLEEADIVCTNPPFSLFRDYIHQLMRYNKKFLIIGNKNAITYKEVFPLIQENKVWLGYTSPKDFVTPKGELSGKMSGLTRWFTNLDVSKRHEDMVLYETYSPEKYPSYDNYPGINVDKVTEIPKDYYDIMGVPITFIDKYNPDQFEILGITDRHNSSGLRTKVYGPDDSPKYNDLNRRSVIKTNTGYREPYARILIKRKEKKDE